MPSMRGLDLDKGSKKRYAGTVQTDQGCELIFKGLEAVRRDWTPLARQFQRQLFEKIFAEQDYQSWLKVEVAALLSGQRDEQLVYRKRLRRPLPEYQRNVPPHAQAAQLLDDWRVQQGWPALYAEQGGWIEYVITLNGPQPIALWQLGQTSSLDYQHYLEKQLAPVSDGLLALQGTGLMAICDQQLSLF